MSGNFIAIRQFIYVPGNLIDANQNNANENEVYNKHNGSMNEITGHQHTGAPGDAPKITIDGVDLGDFVFPTGTLCTMSIAPGTGEACIYYGPSNNDRQFTIADPGANDFFVTRKNVIVDGPGVGSVTFTFVNSALNLAVTIPNPGVPALMVLNEGDTNFDSGTFFIDAVNNRVYVGATSSAITAYQFQNIQAKVGSEVGILANNTDNTNAASHAYISSAVGGASAGDPVFALDIFGQATWSIGLDNSDGDRFKISASGTVGTNTMLNISSANNTGDIVFRTQTGGAFSDKVIIENNGTLLLPDVDPPAANRFTRHSGVQARIRWRDIGAVQEADYNISGFTDFGTGQYQIDFDTNFASSTAYTCFASAENVDKGAVAQSSGTTDAVLSTFTCSDGMSVADQNFSFCAMGAQ